MHPIFPGVDKELPSSKHPFIPNFYSIWLQITGIFLFPTKSYFLGPSSSKPTVNLIHSIWIIILFSLMTFVCAMAIYEATDVYERELQRLEFFTLISFYYRLSIYIQAPITILYFVYKRHQVLSLTNSLQHLFHHLQTPTCSRSITRIFLAVLLWTFISVSALMAGLAYNAYDVIKQVNLSWVHTTRPYFFGWTEFPLAGQVVLQMIFNFITETYNITPHLLLTVLVFFLRTCYRRVKTNVLNTSRFQDPGEHVTALRKCREDFHHCGVLTRLLNRAFAGIVLVCFVRDFVTVIALIGKALRIRREQEDSYHVAYDALASNYVYCFAAFGIVNMFLRLGVCVDCHEQAQSLRHILLDKSFSTSHVEVREECESFANQLHHHDGTVSAYGFFHIDKQFAVEFFALLATYYVLIYQTRDTKTDLMELAHEKDLLEQTAELRKMLELLFNATHAVV